MPLGHLPRIAKPFAVAALLAGALGGCAAKGLGHRPVPEARLEAVSVRGLPGEIRFWGDAAPPNIEAMLAKTYQQSGPRIAAIAATTGRYDVAFLALSGGADDGAFGAGLLAGWTETGARPSFELVTGVSTGALIAPFAFLGPAYDATLREVYTTTDSDAVFDGGVFSALSGLTRGAALTDTAPLKRRIEAYIDDRVIAAIAAEYRTGRRLFIGTTNIEAQRPVIWDIGAIADSGAPGSADLIREVILASTAIPGVFPPVPIEVSAGGERFTELHVDGGVSNQVFLYPVEVELERLARLSTIATERVVYVIRNTKLLPEYRPVDLSLFAIASRSISSMIKFQGLGDVYKLHAIAERDKLDYRLAYVPNSFQETADELFDPAYMSALYQLGYDAAKAGYPWKTAPPGLFPGRARAE